MRFIFHFFLKHLHCIRPNEWGRSRPGLWQIVHSDLEIWFSMIHFHKFVLLQFASASQDASRFQKEDLGRWSESSWSSSQSVSCAHLTVPAVGFLWACGRRAWNREDCCCCFYCSSNVIAKCSRVFELWQCSLDLLHCWSWESRLWLQVSRW